MRIILQFAVLAGLLLPPMQLRAQRLISVDPLTAKAGDTVSVTGEGIDKDVVDILYLTDGSNDIKLDMVDQNGSAIKFKVPEKIKAGSWTLMIHTKKDQLLEQPVKLTVQE